MVDNFRVIFNDGDTILESIAFFKNEEEANLFACKEAGIDWTVYLPPYKKARNMELMRAALENEQPNDGRGYNVWRTADWLNLLEEIENDAD